MPPTPTDRLYLADGDALEADATVVAARDGRIAVDRSCFYPGGGGQPCDVGEIRLADGRPIAIAAVDAGDDGVIWHTLAADAPGDAAALAGTAVRLVVDGERRRALSRYHTVLHVLNTIAMRDYGAWITGAQIAAEYARIDFKWEGFSPALRSGIEAKVGAVLAQGHPISSSWLPEAQFRERGDLLRTLEVSPPVIDGRVRVVSIEGFDAQACGGTHVRETGEIGLFSISRTENKGKINKRLYVRLDAHSS